MRTLLDEMLALVSPVEHTPTYNPRPRGLLPATWKQSEEDAYKHMLLAPGIPKDEIQVEVKGRILRVSFDSENTQAALPYPSFSHEWTLPTDADPENIEARHIDGILTIQVNKLASITQTRQIAVV